MFFRTAKTEQDDGRQLNRLRQLSQGKPDLDSIAAELENPSLPVRIEAARLLGEIGDAHSLSPLKRALLNGYTGRSPRWHRLVGIMSTAGVFALIVFLLLVLCVAIAFVFSCGSPGFGWGGSPSPVELWHDLSKHRR